MKRLAIIIAYLVLSLTAVAGTFTLMALTSSTAYAHDSDSSDAGASRNVDESRPLNATGELRVDNLAGTVKVAAWDKNEVRVTGSLGELVQKLKIEGDASSLEIKVVLPHGDMHDDDCGSCADLQIQVPKGVRLEVSTVSADVQANGLSGQVRIGTVSGGIVMNSEASHIEAKTVSGDIQLVGSGKGASIDANSVSGTERISDVDGRVDAENVSGDMRIASRHVSGLKMSSTSGNLSFDGALLKGGNYDLNNVSGDVELVVGSSPDARFDISSFSGDIDNSFGPKATRVSKYSPGMELHFSSGSSSATVTARTLSGDIHLQN